MERYWPLILTAILALASPASAQEIPNPLGTNQTFAGVIGEVAKWALGIGGPLAGLMAVVGGYIYLTSGGNEDRVKLGTKTLTWAAIGFAILLVSASLAALIQNILT